MTPADDTCRHLQSTPTTVASPAPDASAQAVSEKGREVGRLAQRLHFRGESLVLAKTLPPRHTCECERLNAKDGERLLNAVPEGWCLTCKALIGNLVGTATGCAMGWKAFK